MSEPRDVDEFGVEPRFPRPTSESGHQREEIAVRPQIREMPGPGALPRKSGELVFHDDWERRAFALAVTLCEQGHFAWDEFRAHLVASIAASGETPEHPDLSAPGYYEHWLAALERTLADKGLVSKTS